MGATSLVVKMSYDDLEHRRTTEQFELKDVSTHADIKFAWPDEEEEQEEFELSKSRRLLNAIARIPKRYRVSMFLGVPENKKAVEYDDESRIDYFPIQIQEPGDFTDYWLKKCPKEARNGSIRHFSSN